MSDKPTEPDWKAVAQMSMQQRDRAEQKANNMELDVLLAQQREAALHAQIAELLVEKAPPVPDDVVVPSSLNGSKRAAAAPG